MRKTWYKGISFGLSFCMVASTFMSPVPALAKQPAVNVLRTEVLEEKLNDLTQDITEGLTGTQDTENTENVETPQEPAVEDEDAGGIEEVTDEPEIEGIGNGEIKTVTGGGAKVKVVTGSSLEVVPVSYGGIYETWKNAGGKPAGTQEVVTDDKGESWLHIVTGSENNNANSTHAFVTENGTFDAKEPVYLQATIKAGSSAADTRTGFYLNYSNDENGVVTGAFIGYDPDGWFWQIYDGKANDYYKGTREPGLEIGEEVTVKIEIKEDKMNVWLMKKDNTVTKLFTDVPVGTIPEKTGKVAIKAAAWRTTNTDIYLKDIYYSNQQPSEVNKYNVEVQVIDDSKASVAGATVELGGKKYITDGDGKITIEDCLPSKYQVYVQANGYEENSKSITVTNENVAVTIEIEKQVFESISTSEMTAVVDMKFPRVIQYNMNDGSIFYAQTQKLDTITINGVDVKPTVTSKKSEDGNTITYTMTAKDNDNSIDAVINAEIKVYDNIVEFNITNIQDNKIVKTIEIKNHNLVSVRSDQGNARIDGTYYLSTNTHNKGDYGVAVDETLNVAKEAKRGYLYAFVSNGSYSAGLWSNSENQINSDWQRVTATASQLRGDIKTVGLSSTYWTYQKSEDHRKEDGTLEYKDETVLKVAGELPSTKIIITPDINGDNIADWQDGAIAYRKIMNNPVGSERVPNLVAYRICMNFSSQAQNPFLMTLDNVKKVYLNTDGLGQSILLKGYGSEGHDSGHLNYADIGTRIGGAEDMKYLLEKGADYGATFGIHVNASETYPESKYFNYDILRKEDKYVAVAGQEENSRIIDDFALYGWNWLDQGININADYDLRNGRADRWKDLIEALGGNPKDQSGAGLDFIYVDVWGNGQSGDNGTWPSRQLAKELTTLGWRVAGEWGHANEYDSTFQHWAADLTYGGYSSKGINSTIARFIRNHQKDSWIGNYTSYGGAADAPLLGGYNMKDFEGWQGRSDYAAYINTLFDVNVPSKFVQHFEVMNWVDGEEVSMTDNGQTYRWTPGMEATLTSLDQYAKDGNKSTLNIKRKSNDFKKDKIGYRTRTMTLDGKTVYEGYEGSVKYLIPWNWDENGNVLENSEEKLYHWNTTENKTSEWELPASWQGLSTVKLYSLDDLGKTFVKEVTVKDNKIILDVDAKTPYVIYKGEAKPKEELNWSERMHLSDVGFNSGSLNPYWTVSGGNGNAIIAKSQGANPMLKISDNTEKVTVSQKLTDLKPNTDYAIYVGVDNRSEAKAGIAITGVTGTKTSSETGISIAKNYIKAYAHNTDIKMSVTTTVDNTSYFQNMYTFFRTGNDVSNVVVNLYKEAGDGASYFDDVRVVETKADNWDKWESEGIFTQDFENVVQGIYPFVIGDIEGVNDNRTHLAEKHVPYTQRGWNNDEFMNKMIDDVIKGNWSLKTNGLVQYQRLVYQTIPQNFTFEPGQSYTVSFDYEAGGDGTYAFVVGDQPYENQQYSIRKDLSVTATEDPNDGKAKHFTFNVVGSETGQTWIGIYSTENAPDMHGLDQILVWNANTGEWEWFSGSANFSGYKDFVLDNLEIRKVDVNKTKLWTAMEEVKGKIERFYTKESYKNYVNTLKRAQSVYDSEFATQEEVDKTTEDVYKAEKSLVEITVTKEVLTSLIQEFEAKHPAENYSEKGWTRFLITLNYAKAAANDAASSQELLRKAYQDLILEEMLLADDPGPSKQTSAGEISVDNFDVSAGNAQPGEGADQAIDDNASTVWHTSWGGAALTDSWFKFTLKSPETVDGLKYLPRASGSNGKITKYEIYVKKENEENYTLVAAGDWTTNTEWKVVKFDEAQENVKEVVLMPIATVGDSPDFFTSAAELRITGPIKEDQPAPTGLKSTPDSSRENAAGNGTITNVTPDMEYTDELFGTYQPIESTEITGLKAGDYYVRYKGTTTLKDSLPTKVTVFSVKAPDPTPVPSTPTPTETPKEDTSDKVIIEAGDSSISVEVKVETTEEGVANTTVVIPEEDVKKLTETATKENPIDVAIPVPNDKLVELLEKEEVKTATTTIVVPTDILENEHVTVSKVTLDSKVLTAVKDAGKDLKVEVKSSEEKVLYIWEIKAEDMKNTTQAIQNMNLHVTVAAETKEYTSKKTESVSISIAQQGVLPVQAGVKVFVGTGKEFTNKKVYVYHKNEDGKLETLPFSYKYKVDKDGYVDLSILQGGDYVVLQEPADRSVVVNFAEQIKISKTKYLKVGKNVNMNVQLPVTLEKTKTIKDKTRSDAVGAVTIAYQSSNPAVAVVDENGNITPVGSGKAQITTTVTYYTGVKRTYKTSVSVK